MLLQVIEAWPNLTPARRAMVALPTITPVGNSTSGGISFTCRPSSIIQPGGLPTCKSSDQIGSLAFDLAA